MTFKNWWRDLWLDIKYGHWNVVRVQRDLYEYDIMHVPVKREGAEVSYDPGIAFDYYVCCKRSGDKILCSSKREAEGVAAIHNDSRGLEDTNPNGC